MSKLWTVKDLAKAAGVSGARVRQLLIQGQELKGEKITGSWIVRDIEARRWLSKRGVTVEQVEASG